MLTINSRSQFAFRYLAIRANRSDQTFPSQLDTLVIQNGKDDRHNSKSALQTTDNC